jgi:PhoPQ-activated pathogenicity-related protein
MRVSKVPHVPSWTRYVLAVGFFLLPFTSSSIVSGQSTLLLDDAIVTPINRELTALDKYVAEPDATYSWNVLAHQSTPAGDVYVIDLTSQTWLTADEVDRPVWKHWLTVVKPKGTTSDKALLFIAGGGNDSKPPQGPDGMLVQVAMATQSVVAEIKMIPNQPLVFHGDGIPRKEDDLIAYTWDQFLKTGDQRWPARLPMVKSVVRAMDTIETLFGQDEDAAHSVSKFVIAGGSKRGWTTWMTAAVDSRVVAMMPIVIDVLNVDVSMRHHYAAYGFWAPAIGDYVNHKIMHRRNSPRYADLIKLVDPYAYRDRFTMPKCVINATGDQFFLPDSSQFYFDDLPGEKHLCYVPNGEHSLNGTNALDTLIAFYYCIVHDVERPEYEWSFPEADVIEVSCNSAPTNVLLWEATNPTARDFRVDTIGRGYKSRLVKANGDLLYRVKLEEPEAGWKASFVQCEFNVGAPVPMRLSTGVRVLPEELPHLEKEIPTIEGP